MCNWRMSGVENVRRKHPASLVYLPASRDGCRTRTGGRVARGFLLLVERVGDRIQPGVDRPADQLPVAEAEAEAKAKSYGCCPD